MNRECYSLGGSRCQTEEAFSVVRHGSSKLRRIDAARGSNSGDGVGDPRRFVALAAKWDRREIGRVGFDKEPVVRHEPKQRLVSPLFERYDPAERHVPAGIKRELSECVRPRVTMQDACDSRRVRVADDRARIVFRIARVHDHGTAGLSGERDLRGKRGSLGLTRRVVVVIVEPAFADRDSTACQQLAKLGNVSTGFEFCGVVRVNTGGCENEPRVLSRARGGDRRRIDRLTDADDRQCARLAGAGDYLPAVAGERRVREVGVAVDEDCRALVWRGHLRSIQSSTGAAT